MCSAGCWRVSRATEELSRAWLFKGGTCLKKCFFETYRFSEDLDFTIVEPGQLDRDFLISRFKALGSWLYDTTGIELPAELLRFDVYDLKTGGRAGEGRLAYRGPIAPRGGDLPRIKLDLTADERVVLPSVIAPVTHPYTDAPAEGITARCYAFEELFGEKVRALAQRARPRDLYDVINLFRHGDFRNSATSSPRNAISNRSQKHDYPFFLCPVLFFLCPVLYEPAHLVDHPGAFEGAG